MNYIVPTTHNSPFTTNTCASSRETKPPKPKNVQWLSNTEVINLESIWAVEEADTRDGPADDTVSLESEAMDAIVLEISKHPRIANLVFLSKWSWGGGEEGPAKLYSADGKV